MHGNSLVSYVITALVILLVVGLRISRASKVRPLQLERLWVMPAIYGAIVVVLLLETPPADSDWLWCLLALAVGSAFGWYRGRSIKISVDLTTHTLNQQASVVGTILLAALILLRVGLRTVLASEAQSWHLSAALLVDAFLLLALGIIAVQRLEMYLRGRRLLAEAKAPAAAPPSVG